MRFPRENRLAFVVVVAPLCGLALLGAGCSGRGARDARDRAERERTNVSAAEVKPTPVATTTVHSVATPVPGQKPHVIAHAHSLAIATTKKNVYFGDVDDDRIFVVAKTVGAQPERLAQRTPVSGALVAEETSLTWIASPGDAVLRMPLPASSPPVTIREREIFTGVAARGGDVFLVGAATGGGALTRVTGPTAARLASFDAVPRAVFADATNVFVVTPTSVLRTPHQRGPVTTLANGEGIGASAADDACVYVTVKHGSSRAIMRVPKYGGAAIMTSSIEGARDAPIAVRRGEVFFFDAERPVLRALAIDGKAARIVSEDPVFERVNALTVDEDGAWIATGEEAEGAVVHVPIP
jgi:hypothetical protein